MKRVYSGANGMLAGFVQGVLEDHGIGSLVKNEYLGGGAGELPPTECWPEVWIADDADLPRAKALIEELLAPSSPAPAWTCPECGERMEGQFDRCWLCGAPRREPPAGPG